MHVYQIPSPSLFEEPNTIKKAMNLVKRYFINVFFVLGISSLLIVLLYNSSSSQEQEITNRISTTLEDKGFIVSEISVFIKNDEAVVKTNAGTLLVKGLEGNNPTIYKSIAN